MLIWSSGRTCFREVPRGSERFPEGGGKPSTQSPVEESGGLPSEQSDNDCCICSSGVAVGPASEKFPEVAERFPEGGGKPSTQSPVEESGGLPSEQSDNDCCICSSGVAVGPASEKFPEVAERFPEGGGKPSTQSPVEESGGLPSEQSDNDCCICSSGVAVGPASEEVPRRS